MAGGEAPIAALLRLHRAATGLTQEELAERAGVSARTVSDTERGLRTTLYRDTARRLVHGLGLDEQAGARFEAVARGRSRAPGSSHRFRVPAPPTRLVGRDADVRRILAVLHDPATRLVTLTGPGGVGKTRLAIEAATRSEREFPAGVFFISLASLADSQLVASEVAAAVGASPAAATAVEGIADQLRAARVLLVLDTFEHVLEATSVVGDICGRCPNTTLLVTSRAALRLRREHEIPVPALPVSTELDERSAAVELFVERALASRPDLMIGDDVAIDICGRLDGLPLALELAAARVKHMSLESLRDRLHDRLAVLTHGPRDLPARQQTMRDTVAWSYDLLPEAEQAAFRALSVFAAGWTLDSASSVVDGDVLEALSALVDKSLVISDRDGRYRMLDVIRQYAAEQLETRGEREAAQWAHADYCLALAEQAEPEFGARAQEEWFARVESEHDNMRAAMRFVLDEGDGTRATRIAGALWQFWRAQEHFSEGRAWLRDALELPASEDGRTKALWGAAWLAYYQQDYDEAERLSVEGLAIARRNSDPIATRNALAVRGMVAMTQKRYAEALRSFEEGLELCRRAGRSWLLATSILNLATARMHSGDAATAQNLFGEAHALYVELGDRRFANKTRMHLAQAAFLSGDAQRARLCAIEALKGFTAIGDAAGIADVLETMSALQSTNCPGAAASLAGTAAALRDSIDTPPMPFDRIFSESQLDQARRTLGDEAWRAAWQAGREIPLDEAVARATSQDGNAHEVVVPSL